MVCQAIFPLHFIFIAPSTPLCWKHREFALTDMFKSCGLSNTVRVILLTLFCSFYPLQSSFVIHFMRRLSNVWTSHLPSASKEQFATRVFELTFLNKKSLINNVLSNQRLFWFSDTKPNNFMVLWYMLCLSLVPFMVRSTKPGKSIKICSGFPVNYDVEVCGRTVMSMKLVVTSLFRKLGLGNFTYMSTSVFVTTDHK